MMNVLPVRSVARHQSHVGVLLASTRGTNGSSSSVPLMSQGNCRSSRCVWADALDPDDQDKISLQKDNGEATFAPLDASSSGGLGGTSSDVFGPLALLQVGFSESEFKEIQAFMNSMDAQMVALHSADESALAGRLCDALDGEPGYKEAPEGTQTAIIMSGMYTSEVMEVVAAYKDTQLPRTVFAGAVPNNWDSPLTYLIEELYKDAAAAAERARLAAESYQ